MLKSTSTPGILPGIVANTLVSKLLPSIVLVDAVKPVAHLKLREAVDKSLGCRRALLHNKAMQGYMHFLFLCCVPSPPRCTAKTYELPSLVVGDQYQLES